MRWVHISEHEDPTPWLSGGELLLTTGYNLGTPAKQRRYVELLAGSGLAGLGFGTGFDHKRIPKAILDEADEHDLPLFEVPYEMPFIAITERAAARLVNEQYDVLERGVQVHERLERLVIEGRGLDEILASTGGAIGGTARGARPRAGASSRAMRATAGSPATVGPSARSPRRSPPRPPSAPAAVRARRTGELAARALRGPRARAAAAARRTPGWR